MHRLGFPRWGFHLPGNVTAHAATENAMRGLPNHGPPRSATEAHEKCGQTERKLLRQGEGSEKIFHAQHR